MTIEGMHDFIILLKNEGQGGYHSPEEIDIALNNSSSDKFNEEKREFERTSFISDNLSNFKKKSTITLTSGFGPLPGDYAMRTNASVVGAKRVDIVPESEWIERLNDPIDTPSVTYPILAIRDQVEINPTTITGMVLYYLRRPAVMIFNYNSDDDGNPIYTSSGSVECDWPVDCREDICLRALAYLGVPLNDEMALRLKAYKLQTEKV